MTIYDDDNLVRQLTLEALAHGSAIFQIHRLARSDALHVLRLLRLFQPPGGARVIDGGCGVGDVALRMSRRRLDLDWTLLNISGAQLRLCPRGMHKIQASLEQIPMPPATSEAMMICYAIGHVDLDRTIAEAARVLTPGGILFVYDLVTEDPARLRERLGYNAPSAGALAEVASRSGFAVDFLIRPQPTSLEQFHKLMPPEECAEALRGVEPVAARFIRC